MSYGVVHTSLHEVSASPRNNVGIDCIYQFDLVNSGSSPYWSLWNVVTSKEAFSTYATHGDLTDPQIGYL